MRAYILGACGVVLVLAGLGTDRLGAEEERRPSDETQRYLERYAQFVSLLQEARFKYVGSRARSTPREALAGRWEESGTLSLSAAQRSYHLTEVSNRVHPDHEDLGATEDLATPKRYLEVSVSTKEQIVKKTSPYGVSTLPEVRGNEWAKQTSDHPLGVMLGFAQVGGEERSLLAICAIAEREWLPEEEVNSKQLVGFLAKSDALEIRALFDPKNENRLAELRISRRSDKSAPAAAELTSVSLSILEMPYRDGKPSSIKLKIVRRYAGGLLDLTESGQSVTKPRHAEIEPQTWEFTYQVNQINYAPETAWFTLENAIPNGTSVRIEGLQGVPWMEATFTGTIGGVEYTSSRIADLELYWKDGQLTPLPSK